MPDDRSFRIDDLDVEELRDHIRDQQLIDAFSHWVAHFAPKVDDVISGISLAFADTRLDDGIGLFQATGLDDYASDEELQQLRDRERKDKIGGESLTPILSAAMPRPLSSTRRDLFFTFLHS